MKRLKISYSYLICLLLIVRLIHAQELKTISVLNLDPVGVSQQEARVITDRIRSTLSRSGIYNVQERGKMEAILGEMKFQLSGITSEVQAVEAGKLLGAEKMLYGSIGHLGEFFTIELFILDVETGSIEQSSSFEIKGNIGQLLQGAEESLNELLGLTPSDQVEESLTLKPLVAEMSISSIPKDAVIMINGIEYNKNPLLLSDVSTGFYKILIEKEFYYPKADTLFIQARERIDKEYRLDPKMGTLSVASKIKDLSLIINSQTFNTTDEINLQEGTYALVATKTGYYPYKAEVQIQANKVNDYVLKPRLALPDYERLRKTRSYGIYTVSATVVLSAIAFIWAESSYDNYHNASTLADAQAYKQSTQAGDLLLKGALTIGIGSGVYTGYMQYKIIHLQKLIGLK